MSQLCTPRVVLLCLLTTGVLVMTTVAALALIDACRPEPSWGFTRRSWDFTVLSILLLSLFACIVAWAARSYGRWFVAAFALHVTVFVGTLTLSVFG